MVDGSSRIWQYGSPSLAAVAGLSRSSGSNKPVAVRPSRQGFQRLIPWLYVQRRKFAAVSHWLRCLLAKRDLSGQSYDL